MIELVKYLYGPGPNHFNAGFVVGCDPNIGITIVNADNPEEFLICYNGPLSPHTNNLDMFDMDMWTLKYETISKQIATGVVNIMAVPWNRTHTAAIIASCPFGE